MHRIVSLIAVGLFAMPLVFASSAALATTLDEAKPVPSATEVHQERATGLPAGLLAVPVSNATNDTV